MRENEIRDLLAQRIELIEHGLELIAKNYPLLNAVGTRGYIDMLARDRHGVFVVIELKRADKTAREALHEIMKYTGLLQREKGINAADTRAIIISTHWNELLVPFSHFKLGWDGELRGYELHLASDGVTPVSLSEVTSLVEPPERGLSPIHLLIYCKSDQNSTVEDAWKRGVDILKQVGADDLLGIEIRNKENRVILYLVLGRMLLDDPRTSELDYLTEEIPDNTIEAPEGYALEYRALCYMTSRFEEYGIGTAHPEKFAALTKTGGWQIERLLRAGVFERQIDLYSDDDLVGHVVETAGQSQVLFQSSAQPAHRQNWLSFRRKLGNSLIGNDAWRDLLSAWLDEAETNSPRDDVVLKIYNPCDFVVGLIHGWPDDLGAYLPEVQGMIDALPPAGRMLRGTLTWTGHSVKSIRDAFRAVYQVPADWAVARAGGEVWMADLVLLSRLNLQYSIFEWCDERPNGAMLEIIDGVLHRRDAIMSSKNSSPDWENTYPLGDFLKIYSAQIDRVVAEFRTKTYVDLANGYQLTWS